MSRDQLDVKQNQIEQLKKELYESQLQLQQMRDNQLTEVNKYKAALEKAEEEKVKMEQRHNQALEQIIKDMNDRVNDEKSKHEALEKKLNLILKEKLRLEQEIKGFNEHLGKVEAKLRDKNSVMAQQEETIQKLHKSLEKAES